MRIRQFGVLFVLAVVVGFGVCAISANWPPANAGGSDRPTPTGTATPIATPMITTRTVTGPQTNPTLRTDCDFYFANWGESRWPGTKLRPWSYQGFYLRRNLSGKVVCGLFDADVNRIVNGR